MRDADVLVVGAGPGGSIAGLLLARAGLDVLLLDRASFPRAKPCGECLSAAATRLLDRHGLLDQVRAAGASTLARWDIVAPDGTVARGRLGEPALALERRILDALLLDAAVAAGARFQRGRVSELYRETGRVAGVVADGSILVAPVVVGADGLRSVVARELGVIRRKPRLRKVSFTAHVDPPADMSHGEMHILDGGCVGFAPVGPSANLTLVTTTASAVDLGSVGPEAYVRRWLRKVPNLWERYGEEPLGPLLASGPFDWPTRSAVGPGAALVGDAAGYYDPFTGQGIYQAMAGAEVLARVLVPVLKDWKGSGSSAPDRRAVDRALAAYATEKGRLTRPTRRVQRGVEAVLSRPGLANRTLSRLSRARPAMNRLVEVTGDLKPPRSLLSGAVVSSLVFPRDGASHDPQ